MTLNDPVAILYQAIEPPVIDGLRKAAKPGGYSDSGADIGFALRHAGRAVVTPVADPDPTRAMDWVFPDTADGITAALAAGATVLWANTVVFRGHPIEAVPKHIAIVGPVPAAMEAVDDKLATNARLRAAGLPVAASVIVDRGGVDTIALPLPLVVKPVRGRGSQGVTVVRDADSLRRAVVALIAEGAFGDTAMVEQFLPGTEITITVLPPGTGGDGGVWALPPVRRFDQVADVAPYNGDVAVVLNSVAMTPAERADPAVVAMVDACVAAATVLAIRAAMRIDCRADAMGRYVLFDVNAKPNITGAGRPGREAQDSLSTIAAQAIGWRYADLLTALLSAARRGGG